VKEKDAVTLVGGGELHTKVVEGKEAEGKALAESAVPEFLEQEGSTLSSTERRALEKKRSPLAQSEIVYPLLRRAEITLKRGMVETPVTVDPGGTKITTVDCPEYILIDAKAHFALNDALKGKKGP
jgi:phosphatidate phosphatase APP1